MVRNTIATLAVVCAALTASAGVRHPTLTPAAASAGYGILAAPQQAWAWPPLLPVPVRALSPGSAVAVDLEADQAKWEASVVAWQMAETLGRLTAKAPAAAASTSGPPPGYPAQGQVSDQSHPDDSGVFDRLAQCEAGGNWSISTGNGYYGGLQFTLSSWRAVGGQGMPHQASRETQIEMGRRLQARQGWGAWPHCSRAIGLR